jgi:succinoglycan biosynthesis transport protein ExoP
MSFLPGDMSSVQPATPIGGDRGLIDYLRGIRRGWWIILVSTIVVVAAAVGVTSQQQEAYRASGELLLALPSDPLSNSAPAVDAAFVPTQIQILESPAITEGVPASLQSTQGISAAQFGTTNIVELSAESSDARRAARIVNAYAKSYIKLQRHQGAQAVLQLSKQLQAKIGDLDESIATLDAQVASAAPEARVALSAQLAAERSALVSQQALYRQKLDEQSFEAVVGQGGSRVVRPAFAPSSPVSPTPVRNALLALAFGLLLGIALALLFDHFNDTIRNREDLERAVAGTGLPVLGHVPASAPKQKKRAHITSLATPTSRAAEAYRSLRTAVHFLCLDKGIGILQVTSPIAAEGKSTTAANLAAVLAQAGQRVLILDCDLRRPRIHEYFGLSNEIGFTSVLLGQVPLESALQRVENDDHLSLMLMASGPIPPNPSELLASERAASVLHDLQSHADIVIVDSPPLLPVTDAAIVATMVEASLLVVMAGLTTRKSTQRAIERLAQVDANLIGLVLNRTPAEFEYAYGYSYESGRRSSSVPTGGRHEIPS